MKPKKIFCKNGECITYKEGVIEVSIADKKLVFTLRDKPKFDNDSGESVTELSGLLSDGVEEESWANALYEHGGYSPLHYHTKGTEHYYITAGCARVMIDGEQHDLKAGDSIVILPGQQHQVHNVGEEENLMLIVKCTPSWTVNDYHLVQQGEEEKKPLLPAP